MSRHFLKVIGPGILFAGAAIGTSHLVQSTRAGAVFGLGLVVIVIGINILKYPIYRFGPLYAAATGRSLLEGYALLGRPIVAFYAISELAVTAIVIGASALTTAAMLLAVVNIDIDVRHVGAGLTVLGIVLLWTGGYKLLDRLTKIFVSILTVCTLIATIIALPKIQWSVAAFAFPAIDVPTYAFIIALMGFMPAGMELSVMHSLWSVAKAKALGVAINPDQALADFNMGYIGSAVLAVCFLLMGAGVMHTTGVVPAEGAAKFAKQVIGLYTSNLGQWSGVVVGVCAVSVMFTTLLTILDGFPRLQAASWYCALTDVDLADVQLEKTRLYLVMMIVLSAGGLAILYAFMRSFRAFIDFVTITAFVLGPITALLNHLVINSQSVPAEWRPGRVMNYWSLFAIFVLTGLAIAYLVQHFL